MANGENQAQAGMMMDRRDGDERRLSDERRGEIRVDGHERRINTGDRRAEINNNSVGSGIVIRTGG